MSENVKVVVTDLYCADYLIRCCTNDFIENLEDLDVETQEELHNTSNIAIEANIDWYIEKGTIDYEIAKYLQNAIIWINKYFTKEEALELITNPEIILLKDQKFANKEIQEILNSAFVAYALRNI